MTCTPTACCRRLRGSSLPNLRVGPTGESWPCAREITTPRRNGSDRARDLAPQNDRIYDLLGILDSQRGQSAQAIADLRKAVELNPKNLRALYRLAEETERQGDENGAGEVQQLLQKILAAQPDNLAALLELSRIAAKRGDAATLKSAVAQISARSSAWPPKCNINWQPCSRPQPPRTCARPPPRRRFCAT